MTWSVFNIELDADKTTTDEEVGTLKTVWDQAGPDQFFFTDRTEFTALGLDDYKAKANAARTAESALDAKETDPAIITKIENKMNS